MLKVILMLDCNICGQPFDRIISSCDPNPETWKSLSGDLEYSAERCGWSFHRSAHHCDYCISDARLSGLQAIAEAEREENDDVPF